MALCGDPDPNNVVGGGAAAGEVVGQAGAQAGDPADELWEDLQDRLVAIAARPENYKAP